MMIQFRFTIAGILCAWREDTIEAFLKDCEVWALNNAPFSDEFR